MKKINIIVAAAALSLFASCNREVGFEHTPFATLNSVTYSVDENVGKVIVPVTLYNPTGKEVQVTVTSIDGVGVEGADYEIVSPASGLLTFSPTDTTKNIEVNITDFSGEFTGSKDFKIQIASATDGLTVGALNTASFTIKDLDHPLAMFIGIWTGNIDSYFDGGAIPMTFEIKANDDDKTYSSVRIENFDPSITAAGGTAANGYNIYTGTVNAEKTKITIEMGQPTGIPGYSLVGFDSTHITTATGYENIVIDYKDEKLTIEKGWGTTDGTGYWYGIYGGPTVFTRK